MEVDLAQLAKIRENLATGKSLRSALAEVPLIFTDELAGVQNRVQSQIFGLGDTLTPLLSDSAVTDILINGPGQVWVDRGAGLIALSIDDPQLTEESNVRALAVRLAAACGQRLDDASPIVDGTFSSGMRLHAVLPPLAAEGTLISLRLHQERKFSLADLVKTGSVHITVASILRQLVQCHANVIISGATGAGKTTFLSAMLALASPQERILVIEESAELRPDHPHVLHLQVRQPNVQGAGEVSMSQLVRAAMRMRPDRIVLGECRGAEVRDVLGALNTGHDGGWATVHANSAQDVPARLVALGALAQMNELTVAAQAASALDAIVHIKRAGAKRFVSEIAVLERVGSTLHANCVLQVNAQGELEWGEAKEQFFREQQLKTR